MAEHARKPRGYRGVDHETLGADILAVHHALQAMTTTDSVPGRILGEVAMGRMSGMAPDGWYPIAWLLQMMESIEAKIGRFGLIKVGRVLFQQSHEARLGDQLATGYDVIHGIDGMYRFSNRGDDIGGWRVVEFDSARAVLENNTLHPCVMEEGILAQALKAVGSPSTVMQSQCFRDGADCCVYAIEPSSSVGPWAPGDDA